jgi:hypothetical protein
MKKILKKSKKLDGCIEKNMKNWSKKQADERLK